MFLPPHPFDDDLPPRRRPPVFAALSGRAGGVLRRSRGRRLAAAAVAVALAVLAVAAVRGGCEGAESAPLPRLRPAAPSGPDLFSPVRPAPAAFPRGAKLPGPVERDASGPIDLNSFSAGRDLVYVEDDRCWWESDHDAAENDVECDHSLHAAAEIPFRRLVNLVAASEGTNSQLRVQEAFRATGIHSARSLHTEGRAVDLTLGRPGAAESYRGAESAAALERLAKLCWQAGFDWVYFETPRGGGPHVHASVRRDAPRLRAVPDGLPPKPSKPSAP